MKTVLSVREGNAPVTSTVHRAVRNFDEVG
jgi:hypothetical protein